MVEHENISAMLQIVNNNRFEHAGLELSGGWGVEPPPQFMSTDAHFE